MRSSPGRVSRPYWPARTSGRSPRSGPRRRPLRRWCRGLLRGWWSRTRGLRHHRQPRPPCPGRALRRYFPGPRSLVLSLALPLACPPGPPARAAVWRRTQALPWPLALVLVVQAAGSLRLLRADTAFQDEALYLWAGHMEWSHWLHGTTMPLFPTFFSGARCCTRRSARWPTAWAAWWRPGSCRWPSCSARRRCCGARPPGCTGGGPPSSPRRAGPCSGPPCS